MADRPKNNPSLGFTENGTHGVNSGTHGDRGGVNENVDSGMLADVVAIPNVGRTIKAPGEFPSPVAGTMFDGDHEVVNPMDTD